MPNWKKVVVSGSNAQLNNITASGNISASGDIEALTFTSPFFDFGGGSIHVTTNIPLIFGSTVSADVGRLQIKHDDSDGSIINITGDLTITNSGTGDTVIANQGANGRIILAPNETPGPNTNSGQVLISGSSDGGDPHLFVMGEITASGNISSSGTITTSGATIKGHLVGKNSGLSDSHLTGFTNIQGYGNFQMGNSTTVDSHTITGKSKFVGNVTASGNISASGTVQGLTGSFHALVGDTSQATSLEVDGHITASGNISSSGYVYSKNAQYWSTNGRLTVGNNTTNYYGPNPQGTNYYYWSRDLGTSSTTITGKTTTLNTGWKLPYKAVLTGYHLNIQGRSTTDNISFTLVYCDGMYDGDVTSTTQTLVEAEGAQTVSIASSNNFYELDRRGQLSIPVSAMTMLYPRFKKTAATGGTSYDFQLAVEYYVVQ